MNTIEKRFVELTKESDSLTLVLNPNDPNRRIMFAPVSDKLLAHDIAIALQSYYRREEKKLKQ